jgi:AAA domain, putative AbiEii toxin, Type IV TA system
MKLISSIKVTNFRSFRSDSIEELGDLTALAGLNNSGKSNLLRALNAFFTGSTDLGRQLSVAADVNRITVKEKKGQRIRISVKFDLPDRFKFKKRIQYVEDFLGGRSFEIAKTWNRQSDTPEYHLNDGSVLTPAERTKIDQFLSLISFRYIPNRVLPLDVIRSEHQSLRNVLIRRLAAKAKDKEEAFGAIRDISTKMVKGLSEHVHDACPDVGGVRLATPTSWQEMVFAFGYKLVSGGVEIDDTAQGSGVQSFLMLQTLSLIDRDYFQKFGWKQAAVWALEEPESSLHTSLEARVAAYLAELSSDPANRLQIIATTHSDLVLQHADRTVFVRKDSDGTTLSAANDKRTVLEEAAKLGISRWVHPILASPLEPIILVEGKYDDAFLREALRLVEPSTRIRVTYLEQLLDHGATGGDDHIVKYIRTNVSALRTRITSAPVLVVFDWDSAAKKKELDKHIADVEACRAYVWPATAFNPRLGKAFHGIERHMSDRIIDAAEAAVELLGTKTDGSVTISKNDYGCFKEAVYQVVKKGLQEADLTYARPFVEEIVAYAQGQVLHD